IIMGMVGGALGDRFGTKRILRMFCLLAGIACALRAFSNGFMTFAATNLLYGLRRFNKSAGLTPNSTPGGF
ncbi:MAG: hypothetical protein V3U73_00870, partial [bacterium]